MTAIAAKKDVRRQPGDILTFQMGAEKILEGALVSVNAAGYLVNATDAANDVFIGVADKTVDNSAGAAGALEMPVRIGGVIDVVFGGTATIADVNTPVYVVDNQTVNLAAVTTNDVLVGRIVEFVTATKVRVALVTPGRA